MTRPPNKRLCIVLKHTRSWILRHKWKSLLIAALLIASITPIIVITRTWFIIHADARPSALPGEVVAEVQTEGFTCGVHALRSVYRAYGMNPDAERMRWRLGADTRAMCWMGDSTGARMGICTGSWENTGTPSILRSMTH